MDPAQEIYRMDEPWPSYESNCLRDEGVGFADAIARRQMAD